jgi:hypothetical protein
MRPASFGIDFMHCIQEIVAHDVPVSQQGFGVGFRWAVANAVIIEIGPKIQQARHTKAKPRLGKEKCTQNLGHKKTIASFDLIVK